MNFSAFKNLRTLVVCAVLAALGVMLKFLSFDLGTLDRLTLTFLPLYICAFTYGAFPAMMVGIVIDILGSILKGYGLMPIYTLTFVVAGLLAGLLYRGLSKANMRPIFSIPICVFAVQLVCSVGMNGVLWPYIVEGPIKMLASLPIRLITNAAYFFIYSALLIFIEPVVLSVAKKLGMPTYNSL